MLSLCEPVISLVTWDDRANRQGDKSAELQKRIHKLKEKSNLAKNVKAIAEYTQDDVVDLTNDTPGKQNDRHVVQVAEDLQIDEDGACLLYTSDAADD